VIKSKAQLVKSKAQLVKSKAQLVKSKAQLVKSKAQIKNPLKNQKRHYPLFYLPNYIPNWCVRRNSLLFLH